MLHNNKHCTLLLYIFLQLKPPLLLYVRVLLVIYLAQKHPLLPNPKRIVSVEPAVNHIFFLGFRMKCHILNDVILVLKILIYSVNFYFAFFHYFAPPSSHPYHPSRNKANLSSPLFTSLSLPSLTRQSPFLYFFLHFSEFYGDIFVV